MCSLVNNVYKFSNDFHVVQSENCPRGLNRLQNHITYNNPNARNSRDILFPITYDRQDSGMGTSSDYQQIHNSNYQNNNQSNDENHPYNIYMDFVDEYYDKSKSEVFNIFSYKFD